MNDMELKRCSQCGENKLLSQFRKKLSRHTHLCKKCMNFNDKNNRDSKRQLVYIEDLPNETWYPLVGYEDMYKVSDKNRVVGLSKKIKRKDGVVVELFPILRKIHKTEDGYWSVRVSKNNVPENISIHVAIAKATKPNPLNLPEVNHLDANKENNNPSNLEWCTHRRNMEHANEMGLIKHRKGVAVHSAVITDDIAAAIFKSSLSGVEAAKKYKVTVAIVSAIRTGKSWNHVTGLSNTRKKYLK